MKTPEPGSRKWVENERTIAHTPELRKLRDQAQGERSSGSRIHGGGGSQQYRDNWERIFGKGTDK